LTPTELYDWAKAHIPGISFFYAPADEIDRHKVTFQLSERYAGVKTIPGTRSRHSFIPCQDGTMLMKRISSDELHTRRIKLYEPEMQTSHSIDVSVTSSTAFSLVNMLPVSMMTAGILEISLNVLMSTVMSLLLS